MSLDGAVVNLASWAGNVMMPTMAGAFFAGAVYRYSKGGQFEQLLYGGFASLMTDKCGWLLDGGDEPGELGCQRDPASLRADTTGGDGDAHGRRCIGDLSRLYMDTQVHRGDGSTDGFWNRPLC